MLNKVKLFQQGLTLVELLLVVGILAGLSAIAIPVYNDQIIASERSRAQSTLYQLQAWVESEYTKNDAYPSSNDLSKGTPKCDHCQLSDLYTFSVAKVGNLPDTRYVLKAAPVEGKKQSSDDCGTLIINAASDVSISGKNGATADQCWK